jgi:PhnB protein
MAAKVKPIPDGYHTVTPYLTVKDGARALDFYKRAFGAQVTVRMDGPNGSVAHAEMKIGDSMVMLGDEMPMPGATKSPQSLGGTTAGIFLYVNDVDSFVKTAVDAGAKVDQPVANMFWGDRYGKLSDPFGHSWSVGTHVEDVAPEEMKKRMQEATSKMGQQTKAAS